MQTTQHTNGKTLTLEAAQELFLRSLTGRNVSSHTITAYQTDIRQFLCFLRENNVTLTTPSKVTRADISEYLSHLSDQELTGVTRARKLAAIREYFRYLLENGYISVSPAASITIPKKERRARVYLRPDEYTKLLTVAQGNPRDYAILQLFLQTGIRVSELINLHVSDVDLAERTLTVRSGKGQKDRVIELEKKAAAALRAHLRIRPNVLDTHLFLNYEGTGISDRGVQKLLDKYRERAGIEKKISCHSLRHTFASYKAAQGVTAFQLQQWLGHQSLSTTQIYVHMERQNSRKVMEATSL